MFRTGCKAYKAAKTAFFALICAFSGLNSANGQANMPINLPKFDHQVVHFGFMLGINSATFHSDLNQYIKQSDTVWSVTPESSAGLNLGIVSNLRIGSYFDLRFIPTLSFTQRNLTYDYRYKGLPAMTTKKIESSYLEFPVDLKFKSQRVNNYRFYVLGGIKYAIDMVSQAKVKDLDKDMVKLSRYDYGYEIGLGMDLYLTYFKLSPEIKMYNGVTNLLVPENTIFANSLHGLYSKTFMVSFLFE